MHGGQIVGAVAQHGNALLAKGREHELPHLALAHRLAGFRIDDLPQEVILGDVLLVALGQTLAGDPRPHDLGEAVVVGADDVHAPLDLGFQARGQGSPPKRPTRRACMQHCP